LFSDFEVKRKEEAERPQGLTVGIPAVPVMPDEIPVESGSVLRQKNEIEMKYGSSPKHPKLSPDHSLWPPPAVDAARLTPTLERYCANDILSLTEEVPEDFLDEDVHEYDREIQLQSDSSAPPRFTDQLPPESHLKHQNIPSDAGSQFQRSFSYRENCQQKQPKTLPFLSRSASLRVKNEAVIGSRPSIVGNTSASSIASFSLTEVCRRLLKEKSQQNECSSAGKLYSAGTQSKQVKSADFCAEKDKELPVSSILNTVQLSAEVLANQTVSKQTESVGDTDCKYQQPRVGSQHLKVNVTKSEALPLVIQDEQATQALSSVSKTAFQQVLSHSTRIRQSVESPVPVKDRGPYHLATAGNNDSMQVVARNTNDENVSSGVIGDTVQESNWSQPAQQVTQADASVESMIQSVQPLPLDGLSQASNITHFTTGQPQPDDAEQFQMLKKRFSFNEKYSSFISTGPGRLWRSQSVRNKTSSSFPRWAMAHSEPLEAQKVKKPYGKTHPLAKLPSTYLSRDCSSTIKDFACDYNAT